MPKENSSMLSQQITEDLTLEQILRKTVETDFVNNFNENDYLLIKNFNDKVPNFTDNELKGILQKARTNSVLQIAIAIHPKTTQEILNSLLTTGRVYADTLKFLVFKSELSPENASLVWNKLTASTKDKLISTQLINKFNFKEGYNPAPSDFSDYYIKGYSNEGLNDEIVNIITENLVNKIIYQMFYHNFQSILE